MKRSIRIAPPNSMFFLEDSGGGRSPEIDERPVNIWSTPSCIIVGCLVFIEGEAEFILSNSLADAPFSSPRFDAMLETPHRMVEVSTSERNVLIRAATAGSQTRVRIWTNQPKYPTHIIAVLA